MKTRILPITYFLNPNVCDLAQDLIGKVIVTNFDDQLTSGIITETEAYCGLTDKACHAYPNKKTNRTEVFYEDGGLSYVYLCYGIHHLFNIITGPKDHPQAILIRSIQPLEGKDIQLQRRNNNSDIASGPGKLTQALGILTKHTNKPLIQKNNIWLEDHALKIPFQKTKRIGIDYAGKDADLLWRYVAH